VGTWSPTGLESYHPSRVRTTGSALNFAGKNMKKRGKILRDPSSGTGLLMIEGRQYPFSRDVAGRSPIAPRPGLVVDVEFDVQGEVESFSAVSESQLAREAVISLSPAPHPAPALLSTGGLLRLAVALLLAATWGFVPAASMQLPFPGSADFTFLDILGYLRSGAVPEPLSSTGAADAGPYTLLAMASLAGPFLRNLWRTRPAELAGLAPLAFMLAVGIAFHRSLGSFAATSPSVGLYISTLLCLYFALTAVHALLAPRPKELPRPASPQKKAA